MKDDTLHLPQTKQPLMKGLLARFPGLAAVNGDPLASACGMAGAFLLATSGDIARWGWVLFLVSNALWIWSGCKVKNKSLVLQYLFFTGTAFYGIYNTFVRL